jgi:hypothetical protein
MENPCGPTSDLAVSSGILWIEHWILDTKLKTATEWDFMELWTVTETAHTTNITKPRLELHEIVFWVNLL